MQSTVLLLWASDGGPKVRLYVGVSRRSIPGDDTARHTPLNYETSVLARQPESFMMNSICEFGRGLDLDSGGIGSDLRALHRYEPPVELHQKQHC